MLVLLNSVQIHIHSPYFHPQGEELKSEQEKQGNAYVICEIIEKRRSLPRIQTATHQRSA